MLRRAAWIVFAVALGVRLIFLVEIAASPSFRIPIVDAATYDALARRLAEGDGIHAGFFWQGAFYPAFLAAVYAVSGSSIIVAKLVQLVLGAITCVLTQRLGRRLGGERVGLAAGLVVAVWGPLVFFEADLVATGWIALFAVALVLLFLRADEHPSAARGAAVGVVGALAITAWSIFVPFYTAGVAVSAVRARSLRFAVAVAIGFAAIAAPVAAVTHAYTETATILPSSGGLNLYLGNNPHVEDTLAARPSTEAWRRIRALPGPTLPEDGYGRSRYYRDLVVSWAQRDPGAFALGLGAKARLFVASPEIPRNEDIYVFRSYSWVLALTVWRVGGVGFPFALLMPLAVVGLLAHRRRLGAHVWLFVTLYPAAVVLVFVSGRYRVPMVPVLAVLAAIGAGAIASWLRARDRRRLGRAALAFAIAAAVTCLPQRAPVGDTDFEAELYRLVGVSAQRRADDREAIAWFARAIAVDPSYADAHYDLALSLRRLGRVDEARAHLKTMLALRPDSEQARRELAR